MNSFWKRIPLLLSALLYLSISYFTERSDFIWLISQVSFLFIFLFVVWKSISDEKELWNNNEIRFWAIAFRFLIIFSIPNLSDDYFRFLWDGMVTAYGFNPYDVIPSEVLSNGFQEELYENMNSKEYYSVYPPLNQFFFSMAAFLFHKNIFLQVLVLKGILFMGELIVIFQLPKLLSLFKIDERFSILYLLNPLVILEIIGNLHFEGLTIAFLMLCISYLTQNKLKLSAVFFGLSAGIKLIPFIFFPAILKFLGFKKGTLFSILAVLIFVIPFLFFFNVDIMRNMFSSLDLYFQSFEFNASIYYLIRFFGFQTVGYNIIQSAGIVLSIGVFLLALIFAYRVIENDIKTLLKYSFYTLLAYYLLSTTIHPWYLINLMFLSLFTSHYRSMFLWTFLCFLSYSAYSNSDYQENFLLITIEYVGFILVFIWELIGMRKNEDTLIQA